MSPLDMSRVAMRPLNATSGRARGSFLTVAAASEAGGSVSSEGDCEVEQEVLIVEDRGMFVRMKKGVRRAKNEMNDCMCLVL